MHQRDYLYCLLNLILDEEEQLNQLCPSCRQRAAEPRCACCGGPLEEAAAENPSFDQAKFDRLREEGAL
jgi:predicted amidophosphoribosyltransferase